MRIELKLRDLQTELKKCGCDITYSRKNRIKIHFGMIPIGNIPNFLEVTNHIVKNIRSSKEEQKQRKE